ncbi:MAG: class I SAM-dependent methyltransferase [Actinobacteria bacterium]|nr:class I SAM-dependent methyltransferase [Actinomycetota bacterium]
MANEKMANMWNSVVGPAWVDHASNYDAGLEPHGHAVMDALGLQSSERVLDVGCGTGATTVELAARVDPGEVVGVDISSTMLQVARDRADRAGAANIAFREADAQTAELGAATFDVAFSRMGVMFFDDPVAAFTNIAGSLRPGGRLGFVCFQDPSRNPYLTLPGMIAGDILQLGPPPPPGGPSPFAFADATRTTDMLQRAGFADVQLVDGVDYFENGDVDDLGELARSMLEQNPMTNQTFSTADTETQTAALAAVAEALAPFRSGTTLRMDAATWIVTAHT